MLSEKERRFGFVAPLIVAVRAEQFRSWASKDLVSPHEPRRVPTDCRSFEVLSQNESKK